MCDILFPNKYECSNHGICSAAKLCECTGVWRGYGDYAKDGVDCDLNIDVIMALWYAALGMQALDLIVVFRALLQKTIQKKDFNIRKSVKEPIALFLVLLLVCDAGAICLSCLKISDYDNYQIGKSYLATFLYDWIYLFEFSAGYLYISVFIGFLSHYMQRMNAELQAKLTRKKHFLHACGIIIISGCSLAFIITMVGVRYHEDHLNTFGSFYFATYCFLAFLLSFCVGVEAMIKMADYIDVPETPEGVTLTQGQLDQNNKLIRLKFWLNILGQGYLNMSSGMNIMLAFLGFWPYFTRKASYLIPLFEIGCCLCKVLVVSSISTCACMASKNPAREVMSKISTHYVSNKKIKVYATGTKSEISRCESPDPKKGNHMEKIEESKV